MCDEKYRFFFNYTPIKARFHLISCESIGAWCSSSFPQQEIVRIFDCVVFMTLYRMTPLKSISNLTSTFFNEKRTRLFIPLFLLLRCLSRNKNTCLSLKNMSNKCYMIRRRDRFDSKMSCKDQIYMIDVHTCNVLRHCCLVMICAKIRLKMIDRRKQRLTSFFF